MHYIDIILLGSLAFALIKGYKNGILIEVASLLGLVLGIYGSIHFSYILGNFISSKFELEPYVTRMISFLGTFLIIWGGLVLLGNLLTKVAKTIALGMLNRMLGAFFSFVKYVLILSVVLNVLYALNEQVKWISKQELAKSNMIQPVKDITTTVFPNLIKVVKNSNEK